MRKISALAVALLLGTAVHAQTVQQTGTVTSGHAVRWVGNGLVGDAGTAANGFITSLGVVNNGGPGVCVQSAASTAVGYNQLCLAVSTTAAAQISLQNYGTATAQNLQFNVNGTVITLPTGGGATIPTITTPLVTGNIICASGTTGALVGCTTGTNGQLFVGQTSGIPLWKTIDGDITSIDASGNVVVGKVNGVTYPASPSVGTAPYVSSANTITYGTIPATAGGTGAVSPTAHGVLIAQGASAMTTASSASIGLCLLSQGASSDPVFGSCASGAGSAGGSNTQVQFNNASSLAGSPNFTWVSPALSIGQNASVTGQIVLANGNALGTAVTVQNVANTSPYNFNLPGSAGTSGQPLLSGGGGSTAMSFGTLGVGGGGTNCTAASGTCVDNISGWASTGFINRTGAGTYSFTSTIGLINGGTSANLTASNGGIVYSTASAMAILSGTATANQVLLSGSSTTPAWSTATYPTTTTADQLLYSSATNTIAGLATANNGVLITSAGGVPSISSTLPSAVQGNITATGTIATGVWNGTAIDLSHGGTNANLTASNGGIFYSTASAGAILSGTATANLPLLSGASTTPSWAAISYPVSATSGGVPYFSSTTAIASSALLGSGQIVIGGGAGAAPSSSANASLSSGTLTLGQAGSVAGSVVLSGSTSGTSTVKVAAIAGTGTIFQLPADNGTTGYVLQTNGSGITSWINPSSGGTVTSITAGNGLQVGTGGGGAITTSGTINMLFDPGSITDCTLNWAVASNNLTVSLKTQAGNDPTAATPCVVSFRNATAATGDYTAVAVTAATSVTLNSGSSLGATNGAPFRVWATAWNNAGTVVLGLSNQSTTSRIYAIDETQVQASTACNACGTATSAGVYYTTAAQTAKAIRIMGFGTWEAGLATAGTWASGPTTAVMYGPGIAPPGQPTGNIWTASTGTPSSGTSSTFSITNLSTAIVIQSAVNLTKLSWNSSFSSDTTATQVQARLYRGTTAACTTGLGPTATYTSFTTGAATPAAASGIIDAPKTASTTSWSYVLCFASSNNSSNVTVNSGSANTITIQEIQG